MCGITITCGFDHETAMDAIDKISVRGPDFTELRSQGDIIIGFSLLSVQGVGIHEQPFLINSINSVESNHEYAILCNGEIYNADFLITTYNLDIPEGSSDCAVIPELLKRYSLPDVCRLLDGDFAIVVLDFNSRTVTLGRDPYGCRPLFFAQYTYDRWAVSSEIKGLPPLELGDDIYHVLPGTVYSQKDDVTTRWHNVPWLKSYPISAKNSLPFLLREAFFSAVAKRLVTNNMLIGSCLSGGLDSSLVACIAAKLIHPRQLHTFSVGMMGSEDLKHARIVATHIGSVHHELILSPEGCVNDIEKVIYAIESADVTTVRASVGNFNVGVLVKEVNQALSIDIRVVLNGDGADELFGGYLYMKAAPDDEAFEFETTRLLTDICLFDVLRSERCMSYHGLECRSPFLDRQLVSFVRSLPTAWLRDPTIEKNILREAFIGFLPNNILFRRKEAFSDGMSGTEKSWYQIAKESCDGNEQHHYMQILKGFYGDIAANAATPYQWMPRFVQATDPSARTLELYT
jgi:asparagine synthase (glutamine-hydrolysing)